MTIKGYRQLDPETLELINKVKLHEEVLLTLVEEIRDHIRAQRANASLTGEQAKAELARLNLAEPERWAAMGRTDFQTGCMALVRALAQPGASK